MALDDLPDAPTGRDAEVPVVVVGAGPVGMVLALDLARRGVRSVLLERAQDTLWYPKGNTHNARTMEHYRRLGLADAVRRTGLPADHPTDVAYFTQLGARELQRLPMPSTTRKLADVGGAGPVDQIPEPLHRANQMYVERVLAQQVRAEPAIQALFGTELRDFAADEAGVTVDVAPATAGTPRRIRARHLVGCDGPRSLVRSQLGLSYRGEDAREPGFMSGLTHSTHLRIPALHARIVERPAWQYWVLRPGGVSNFVNLDGGDEFLYHSTHEAAADESSVRDAVVDALGERVDVEVLDSRDWIAGRALVAEGFGRGRVLLCGDAVHLFTPTGGFGMNTGVDDAANLAWKLAASIHGWAGPDLLASYEAERRPIAVRNTRAALDLARSIRDIPLGPVLEDGGPDGVRARGIAAEVLAGFAEEFASLGIQLGARYDGSPVVVGDGTAPPPDRPEEYVPTACPGGRAPHVWLPDGASLYDRLGSGFTLLRLRSGAPDTAPLAAAGAARGVPVSVLDVPVDEARDLYGCDLALVRPDQHVAWRGDRLPDATGLWDTVAGGALTPGG